MKQKLSPLPTNIMKIEARNILNQNKKRSIDIGLNKRFKLQIIDTNSVNRKHHFNILFHSTVHAMHIWDTHNIQCAQYRMGE